MKVVEISKVIIVEGKSDKKKIVKLMKEPVEVICTNGTLSITKLDEFVDDLAYKDTYIFVDADDSGIKIRKQFKAELPEAKHLYIDKMYREVATAPDHHIASILISANFDIHSEFL